MKRTNELANTQQGKLWKANGKCLIMRTLNAAFYTLLYKMNIRMYDSVESTELITCIRLFVTCTSNEEFCVLFVMHNNDISHDFAKKYQDKYEFPNSKVEAREIPNRYRVSFNWKSTHRHEMRRIWISHRNRITRRTNGRFFIPNAIAPKDYVICVTSSKLCSCYLLQDPTDV